MRRDRAGAVVKFRIGERAAEKQKAVDG